MNSTEQKIQAIFCQSFGPRVDGPGISNEFLAKKIIEAHKNFPNAPLIIQKDCVNALPANIKVARVIYRHWLPDGRYLDSSEVSRQCAEYCVPKGLTTVLTFAHPDHLWRVMKTMKKFDLNPIAGDTNGTPYDPKSVQPWTRSRLRFLIREFLVIIYYFFKKKI